MQTITPEQKQLFPEVRISGSHFTVSGTAAQDNAAPPEVNGKETDSTSPVSDEMTGIIPRHVWG